LTLDESWFYFSTDNERIWLTAEQLVPDRERHMAQSPKLMLTVAWNHSGFYVVAALSKGVKFNDGYYTYTTEILERMKVGGRGTEPTALEN
jgi:hypothetical protein